MQGTHNSTGHIHAVQEVRAGLRQLARGLRQLTREIQRQAESAANGRNHPPSPGRRIHGRYIGLIRNMAAGDRTKVRAVHARWGVEAAIKLALQLRHSR